MPGQFQLVDAGVDISIHGWSQFKSRMGAVGTLARKAMAPLRGMAALIKKIFAPSWMKVMVGGGLLGGMYALLKLSSTAEEVDNKFRNVFKEQAANAKEFVKTFGASVGAWDVEVKRIMSSFQDLFVPLGFVRSEARAMSQEITRLSYDLYSWNDTVRSAEEASRDLSSAVVGNHEAVRKYGIIITENALKAEMMAMGYKGSAQAATNEMKVLARLALIYKGTADAQGDLLRSQESMKSTMGRLWASVKAFGTLLGDVLKPVFTALMNLVDALATVFKPVVGEVLSPVAAWLQTIADVIDDIAAAVRTVKFDTWREQLGKIWSEVSGLLIEAMTTVGKILLSYAKEAGDMMGWHIARALYDNAPWLVRYFSGSAPSALDRDNLHQKHWQDRFGVQQQFRFALEDFREAMKGMLPKGAPTVAEKVAESKADYAAHAAELAEKFKAAIEGVGVKAKKGKATKADSPEVASVAFASLQSHMQKLLDKEQSRQLKLDEERNKKLDDIAKAIHDQPRLEMAH